jgi:signal transduction histidine kinase
MDIGNSEKPGHDWMSGLGVGLRGMSERMRQLGGNLELFSSASGTIITASVPIPEAAEGQVKSV